ncbi:hypothetical protein QQF73_05395 [Marinobacter sp. M216]|uniref:Secreted protein n=1 Tax=Marinobacter albus TaxID=3030833 RepID=A0ABT7H9M7_9GAMM|nr:MULTISPECIES: hypothetical protein [unclassified Marinobacter]MBW7470678.1 hypothetical protein [Marinobacter sp. F4218]MDK9557054.1 hypothetical protein [Marinobacter sp. M216]
MAFHLSSLAVATLVGPAVADVLLLDRGSRDWLVLRARGASFLIGYHRFQKSAGAVSRKRGWGLRWLTMAERKSGPGWPLETEDVDGIGRARIREAHSRRGACCV